MNRMCSSIAVCVFLAMLGCAEEKQDDDPAVLAINNGKALFGTFCGECHPRSGRSDYLKLIPATLLTRRSENELTSWILGTENHREMPNFENLTAQQRRDLAAFLYAQIGK